MGNPARFGWFQYVAVRDGSRRCYPAADGLPVVSLLVHTCRPVRLLGAVDVFARRYLSQLSDDWIFSLRTPLAQFGNPVCMDPAGQNFQGQLYLPAIVEAFRFVIKILDQLTQVTYCADDCLNGTGNRGRS